VGTGARAYTIIVIGRKWRSRFLRCYYQPSGVPSLTDESLYGCYLGSTNKKFWCLIPGSVATMRRNSVACNVFEFATESGPRFRELLSLS
jgi:hypothetical protein